MRGLFLTLFFSTFFAVNAQVDAYQIDIINYLNINGTKQQYNDAYDNMFDVLKKQVVKKEIPEAYWKDFTTKGKDKSLDELVSFLAFAYRKHFTHEEIKEMTAFYKTDAAQKMLSHSPNLTEDDNKIISDYFDSDIAKKIRSKEKELSIDVADISSEWSRDLFAQKMSILVKDGYTKED